MYSIFLLQESSKNKFFFIIKPAPPYFVPPANKQHHPFQAGLTRQINVKPMILTFACRSANTVEAHYSGLKQRIRLL